MYKVLLVDDEKIVKMALRNLIDWEKNGFTIVGSASDGQEALVQIEKTEPDIVITDIKMPNMDGITLIKRMKEKKYACKTIVISNYDEFEMVKEALRLGASDYILKMSLKKDVFLEQLVRVSGEIALERKIQENEKQEKVKTQRYIENMEISIIRDIIQNPKKTLDGLELNNAVSYALMFIVIRKKTNSDIKIMQSAIKSILENTFDSLGKTDIVLSNDSSLIVLLKEEALRDAGIPIEYYCERCQNLIEIYMQLKTTVVYSDYFFGYDHIYAFYEKCKQTAYEDFYQDTYSCWKAHEKARPSQSVELIRQAHMNVLHILHHETVYAYFLRIKNFCILCKESLIPVDQFLLLLAEQFQKAIGYYLEEDCFDALPDYPQQLRDCTSFSDVLLVSQQVETLIATSAHKKSDTGCRGEILQLMHYIEANIEKKFTLSKLAAYVNMNKSYLCRIFKKETGKSMIHYINELKMYKARDYLLDSSLYIKNISSKVGIDDQLYFNRLFNKHFGVSPTEYRNQYTETGQPPTQTTSTRLTGGRP